MVSRTNSPESKQNTDLDTQNAQNGDVSMREEESRPNEHEKHEEEKKSSSKRHVERESRSRSKSRSNTKSRSRSRSRSSSESRSRSRSITRSRSRTRTRSRTRSPKRSSKRRSRTRSRSRGRDKHRRQSRSSRSPYYKRLNPSPCRVLGVFGLNLATEERDIRRVFEKYGRLEKIKLVTDPRTGKSRGFAFIYFEQVSDAEKAKDNLHGAELEDHHLRVEYSISNKEHNPTPGIYMGRSTYRYDTYKSHRYYDDRYSRDRYYHRGSGGYGGSSRRYSRSRTRSRSYDRRRRSYSRD